MIKSRRTMLKQYFFAAIAIALIAFTSSCKQKSRYPGPLSPEESMKTFRFAENFKAEIYATEPLVVDPVMQFDEEGNACCGMLDAYNLTL